MGSRSRASATRGSRATRRAYSVRVRRSPRSADALRPEIAPRPAAAHLHACRPRRLLCWLSDMLNVLLTNDDGIEADGLQALRSALIAVPGVRLAVIAPDGNRSA